MCIRLVSTTVSCIDNSSSVDYDLSTFLKLTKEGKKVIYMDLTFNQSISAEFIQREKDRKWIWVAKGYEYVLRYPENVDVFSFGLLGAKQDSIEVQISIGNSSETCKSNFDQFLADYISQILWKNITFPRAVYNSSKGYICHSIIDDNYIRDYISDISAVKIGYNFVCYMENNKKVQIEKSHMNGIVVFIVLFVYSFFPFFLEMAFYIEDRKRNDGYFFKSDSPYGSSVILTRFLFSGNSKHFAILRIILLLSFLSGVGLLVKASVYDSCQCSLKSSNRNTSFLDAENLYETSIKGYIFGVVHFIVVIVGILSNSHGRLDEFVICDFCNIRKEGFFLKTVKLSIFIPEEKKVEERKGEKTVEGKKEKKKGEKYEGKNNEEEKTKKGNVENPKTEGNVEKQEKEKYLVSLKMKKLSLITSGRFWLEIFFISFNKIPHRKKKKMH